MTVHKICVCKVDTATADETVHTAALRMHDRKVGTLVVVDEGNRPVGMLTDRDLAIRVVAHGVDPFTTTVRDVMSDSPCTVAENTPIETALGMMRSAGCRRLPVVNERDELVGLLSLDDILDLLAEEFGQIGKLLDKESPASIGRA